MLRTIKMIISNVLKAVYQPFLFALVLSVFAMFFVMYLEKYKGIQVKDKVFKGLKDWKNRFKESAKFRRLFYFVIFFVMILFKTLLNRDIELNPVANVIGVWGLYDNHGKFTTQMVENIILFVPLIFFLFFFFETTSKKTSKFFAVMWRTIAISFLSSFAIEMLQLILHLGTWQLSDLCFNTLGGMIGGLIYWMSAKCRRV